MVKAQFKRPTQPSLADEDSEEETGSTTTTTKSKWRRPIISLFGLGLFTLYSVTHYSVDGQETTFQNMVKKSLVLGNEIKWNSTGTVNNTLTTTNPVGDTHDTTTPAPLSTTTTTPPLSAIPAATTSAATTPKPSYCQYWKETTDGFIQAVHDFPDQNSVNTWTAQSPFDPNVNLTMPQLDRELLERALAGKKLCLLGDSTQFQMLQRFHRMLNLTANPHFLRDSILKPNADIGVRDANSRIDRESRLTGSDSFYIPSMSVSRNGEVLNYTTMVLPESEQGQDIQLMWTGFRGINMNQNCFWEQHVWPTLRKYQPDVIVANWGVHMFHHAESPKPLCLINIFLHYEELMQTIVDVAKEVGTKLLLFKTTNLICQEKYPKHLKKGLALNDTAFLDYCRNWLHKWNLHPPDGKRFDFTHEEMDRYCLEGAGTNVNSIKLNNRMKSVAEKAKQQLGPNDELQIEIFNDHDLESCEFTGEGDGLHFLALQLPRIRMLSYMIECLWK